MKEKKVYVAPEVKVFQVKTESVILAGSGDPQLTDLKEEEW